MHNLYYGRKATIRTESGETEWFPRGKRVRQEYILFLYLLNLYTEHITWKTGLDLEEGEVKIGRININNVTKIT